MVLLLNAQSLDANPTPDYTIIGEQMGLCLSGILIIVMFIVLPYNLIWLMMNTDEEMFDQRRSQIGVIYDSIDVGQYSTRLYYLFYVVRRIGLVLIIRYMNKTFHYIFNSYLNIVYIIYLAGFRPWTRSKLIRIEIANEMVYALLNYFLVLFTDLTPDQN